MSKKLTSLMLAGLLGIAMKGLADDWVGVDRRRPTNQIIVSPNGPEDGGDFGPKTPGTKTLGLREALLAAKEQARDVYIAGGSWTADKTVPVVYHLHESLVVPWMQNFRLESGLF